MGSTGKLQIATCHTPRQLFPICQELQVLHSTAGASLITLTPINTGVEALCAWMFPRQGGRARRVLGDTGDNGDNPSSMLYRAVTSCAWRGRETPPTLTSFYPLDSENSPFLPSLYSFLKLTVRNSNSKKTQNEINGANSNSHECNERN